MQLSSVIIPGLVIGGIMVGALSKSSAQKFREGGGQRMVRYALRIGVPVSLGSVGYYTLEGALREPVARYLAGGANLPTAEGDTKATKTTDTVFPPFVVGRPSTQYAATLKWLDRRGVRWAAVELQPGQKQPDAEELESSHSQARSGNFGAESMAEFGREPRDDPYQRHPERREPAPLASEAARASASSSSSSKAEDEELEFALAIRRGRGHHSIREAREVPNASELSSTSPGRPTEPLAGGLEESTREQPTDRTAEGKENPRERTVLESVASSIGGMEQMRQRANEYFESLMQPRGPDDGISPAWLPPTIASRGLAGGITAVFANAMMDSGLKGGARGLGLTVLVGVFLALTVPTFEDIMCTRDEAKRKEEAESVKKY